MNLYSFRSVARNGVCVSDNVLYWLELLYIIVSHRLGALLASKWRRWMYRNATHSKTCIINKISSYNSYFPLYLEYLRLPLEWIVSLSTRSLLFIFNCRCFAALRTKESQRECFGALSFHLNHSAIHLILRIKCILWMYKHFHFSLRIFKTNRFFLLIIFRRTKVAVRFSFSQLIPSLAVRIYAHTIVHFPCLFQCCCCFLHSASVLLLFL